MGNRGKRREEREEGGVGRFPTCTTRLKAVEGMLVGRRGRGGPPVGGRPFIYHGAQKRTDGMMTMMPRERSRFAVKRRSTG